MLSNVSSRFSKSEMEFFRSKMYEGKFRRDIFEALEKFQTIIELRDHLLKVLDPLIKMDQGVVLNDTEKETLKKGIAFIDSFIEKEENK